MPAWAIPGIYVIVSFLAALALPWLEYTYWPAYGDRISVSTAQALLGAVSSGMMAFTGIVFSIAFLLIQYTASAFSKRFILILRRHNVLLHALGLFVATFTFSLGTLTFVDRQGKGWVPIDSIALVGVLLFASVIILAIVIKQLAELRITRVIVMIADAGRTLMADAPPLRNAAPQDIARTEDPHPIVFEGRNALIVNAVDKTALVELAKSNDLTIHVARAAGDAVYHGQLLATIYGKGSVGREAVMRCVPLRPEHFFSTDVRFSLRLLVDAAIMALSPAVNDPTTAVEALDQIVDLMLRLGQSDLETGRVADDEGIVRLIYPAPKWEDYLSLAFDEIRIYGKDSLQVVRRLRAGLLALEETIDAGPRRDAVTVYRSRLDDIVKSVGFDDADWRTAMGIDPQGLGLERGRDIL
jgi:uncharacterized membrane protein